MNRWKYGFAALGFIGTACFAPAAFAAEYIDILTEESQRLTPEQIATADNDTIMEQLRKMKEKKQ